MRVMGLLLASGGGTGAGCRGLGLGGSGSTSGGRLDPRLAESPGGKVPSSPATPNSLGSRGSRLWSGMVVGRRERTQVKEEGRNGPLFSGWRRMLEKCNGGVCARTCTQVCQAHSAHPSESPCHVAWPTPFFRWGNRGAQAPSQLVKEQRTGSQDHQIPALEKLSLTIAVGMPWSRLRGESHGGVKDGHGTGGTDCSHALLFPTAECFICTLLPFSVCRLPASVPGMRSFAGS